MMPHVVVQVIAYWSIEGQKDLDDLFASFENVDYPRDRWRIVVVDNPSPYGRAADYFKRQWLPKVGASLPQITLIESPANDGFSGGHERGWQMAKTFSPDYLYLINQDAVVDHQFLWRIVQAAESNSASAIIQSRIMLKQQPELLNTCGNALHFLGFGFALGYRQRPEVAQSLPIFYASGAGMLLRVSSLEKIGGLFEPEYFMYHEDADVSWRARLAGYDVDYAEDSIVYHRYEFSRSIKKFYWLERNRLLLILSNYYWRTLFLILPVLAVMELGTMYYAVKSGWWFKKISTWFYFFKPSTWMLISRRRTINRKIRITSDHQILKQMVGIITNQEIENNLLNSIVNPFLQIYFVILKFLVRW